MKRMFKFLGIITLVAVIGFSIIACGDGGGGGGNDGGKNTTTYDPTGIWDFTINGESVIVTVTGNNWVYDAPGTDYDDFGTFTRNGNVITIHSTVYNVTTGTFTLTSNTTGTITLNSLAFHPGTYSGTKR